MFPKSPLPNRQLLPLVGKHHITKQRSRWGLGELQLLRSNQPLGHLHRKGGVLIMTQIHSLSAEWLPVSIAPSDGDLEVCVMDYNGIVQALVYPFHKDGAEWVDASNKKHVDIQPTHWPAACFRDLICDPFCSRMRGDTKPQNLSSAMPHNQ